MVTVVDPGHQAGAGVEARQDAGGVALVAVLSSRADRRVRPRWKEQFERRRVARGEQPRRHALPLRVTLMIDHRHSALVPARTSPAHRVLMTPVFNRRLPRAKKPRRGSGTTEPRWGRCRGPRRTGTSSRRRAPRPGLPPGGPPGSGGASLTSGPRPEPRPLGSGIRPAPSWAVAAGSRCAPRRRCHRKAGRGPGAGQAGIGAGPFPRGRVIGRCHRELASSPAAARTLTLSPYRPAPRPLSGQTPGRGFTGQ